MKDPIKIAVVLPRGMVFSETGATSIDLVVKDQVAYNKNPILTSYIVGEEVPRPFKGFDFRPISSSNQRKLHTKYLDEIKKDLPDVVVVHQYPQAASYIARQLPDTPVVLYRHGLLKRNRNWVTKLYKQKRFSKLSKLIFVSEYIKEAFLQDYPDLRGKSSVVSNAVDIDYWQPSQVKKKQICFAGRARADKGIRELVDAFKALDPSDWQLKLALAVQTQQEVEFFAEVSTLCRDTEKIQITKNVKSTQVRDLFAESMIAVLPSIVKEGFPRAVVEAMSCGCATIASDGGGTPEAMGDGGILLDVVTRDSISAALQPLFRDEASIKTWSERARVHAVNNLDSKKSIEKYNAALLELVVG